MTTFDWSIFVLGFIAGYLVSAVVAIIIVEVYARQSDEEPGKE